MTGSESFQLTDVDYHVLVLTSVYRTSITLVSERCHPVKQHAALCLSPNAEQLRVTEAKSWEKKVSSGSDSTSHEHDNNKHLNT